MPGGRGFGYRLQPVAAVCQPPFSSPVFLSIKSNFRIKAEIYVLLITLLNVHSSSEMNVNVSVKNKQVLR